MKIRENRLKEIIREEFESIYEIISGYSTVDSDQGTKARKSDDDDDDESSTKKIILLGDTQISEGALGAALRSRIGASNLRVSTRGVTPRAFLGVNLSQCPEVVLISLGGNGTDGAHELAREIHSKCSEAQIIWSGAPRVAEGASVTHEDRRSINGDLSSLLSQFSYVTFVDPYDHIGEWSIEGDDDENGLRLPERIATEYASILHGHVRDAQQ